VRVINLTKRAHDSAIGNAAKVKLSRLPNDVERLPTSISIAIEFTHKAKRIGLR
jgi:hypothetical protein